MRNQRGITLVALVVTIVVLLILAGTSIAMLQGDNGIITNAQKAQAANKEGEVRSNFENAYNTIKAEVIAKAAIITGYDATSTSGTENNIYSLANQVVSELGLTGTISSTNSSVNGSGYTVSLTGNVITVEYTDSMFKAGGRVAGINLNVLSATYTVSENNVAFAYTYNMSAGATPVHQGMFIK